jgi:hypothetical protein
MPASSTTGNSAAARAPVRAVVPDVLKRRLGGRVIDSRAADRHDIGLASRVVHRYRVLAGDRGGRLERVAVIGAVVPGGGEH